MNEEAKDYNLQGLRLVNVGRYEEALDFFAKAIEIEPEFAEAYKNRGDVYILLDRYVEGNMDLQRAKNLKEGLKPSGRTEVVIQKYDMDSVDDIYDSVFSSDSFDIEDDEFDIDDNVYDYVYSDDTLEHEETLEEIATGSLEPDSFPAILEYIGGFRREVAQAELFKPDEGSLTIVDEETGSEEVVWLAQLTCIRTAGLPKTFAAEQNETDEIEIIETVDGNVYHERVHSEQNLKDLLLCFSTKETTPFIYSLFPRSNVSKRRQEKLLIDILVEKHYIGRDMLKTILEEFKLVSKMKLGKIIAQQAHIPTDDIEAELEKARESGLQGLRTGEVLLASGLIGEVQILDAIEYQEYLRTLKIGQFLIDKGVVSEKDVYSSLAEKHRMPYIDLRNQKISKQALSCLPRSMVVNHEILPLAMKHDTIIIATHFVDMDHLRETIIAQAGCQQVKFVLGQPTLIRNIINLLYSKKE